MLTVIQFQKVLENLYIQRFLAPKLGIFLTQLQQIPLITGLPNSPYKIITFIISFFHMFFSFIVNMNLLFSGKYQNVSYLPPFDVALHNLPIQLYDHIWITCSLKAC